MPTNPQQPRDAGSHDAVTQAKAFIDLLTKKDFSAAEKYFDDTMKAALPQEELQKTWNALVTQAGILKQKANTRIDRKDGYEVVTVTCEFEKAKIDIKVAFDQTTRIVGLFFAPPDTASKYTPPEYVKPDAFRENEVTVRTGEWALPGTLALPTGRGSFPTIVLVHGSGPNDRDETIGPNKIFRDLAWGLASRGIAVLRYEKRTARYAEQLASSKEQFTVKEETIDDVLSAVNLLRKTEGIDGGRIFVLGHSLGGMLVPRIGKLDPTIAGFIVMAGATKPTEDAILDQTRYVFSLHGTISKESQAQLDELEKQVAKVKSLQPSDLQSTMLIFGLPASYWLDLRGYDPSAAACGLKQPMLILQGERDYQVTMEDFGRWQHALRSRQNITFKSYPMLNHLFVAGTGKGTPEEYNVPGHVAEGVINDITQWVKSVHSP